jgi:hypothetical protein
MTRFDSTATEIDTGGTKTQTSLGPSGNYVETDPWTTRTQARLSKSPSAWLRSDMCETLEERDKKLYDYTVTMANAPRCKWTRGLGSGQGSELIIRRQVLESVHQ